MDERTVVLDIDGVIADFEKAFCEKFGWDNRHMTNLEARYPKKADLIGAFVEISRTYENLDLIEKGYRIAKWCRYMDFTIKLVSARPYHLEGTTVHWLIRNKVPYDNLSVARGRKINRIKSINPLFIVDDILDVCLEAREAGIPSFLMDCPWNQGELPKGIARIQTFDKFLDKVPMLLDKNLSL